MNFLSTAPQLTRLSSSARHRVNVVQLQMGRPSNLPFHLLAWGQQHVRERNCRRFFGPVNDTAGTAGNSSGGASVTSIPIQRRLAGRKPDAAAEEEDQYEDDRIDARLVPGEEDGAAAWDGGVFEICRPGAVARPHGGPLNVTYVRRNSHSSGSSHSVHSDSSTSSGLGGSKPRAQYQTPIRFVYFTESDQIVSFDTVDTLRALSAASNDSCFFTGRRREKAADSDPTDYMGSLDNWRNCGAPGYSLHWPRDVHVKFD